MFLYGNIYGEGAGVCDVAKICRTMQFGYSLRLIDIVAAIKVANRINILCFQPRFSNFMYFFRR